MSLNFLSCSEGTRSRRLGGRARARMLQLAVAALSLRAASSVYGAPKTWVGTDGLFWNNINAWSPAVVPVNGDDVTLGTSNPGTANVQANFTSVYTGAGLNSLKINPTAITGIFTVSQSLTNSAMIAGTEIIGDTVGRSLYTQNGGSNSATTSITLGNGVNGFGCYTLIGGSNVTVNTPTFTVGSAGGGNLTQSGGSISTALLDMGNSSGSSAVYNLSSTGSLSVTTFEDGLLGNATVNQSGGTVALTGELTVAILGGESSTYNLSGGNISLVGSSASIGVGQLGVGNFSQTGGNINFAGGGLFLATAFLGSVGNYTLSNNGCMSGAGTEWIGQAGTGTFFQTGGNNTTFGNITVGEGGPGNYVLSATTGAGIVSAGNLTVGDIGIGNFTQNGGSVAVTSAMGSLEIANNPSSSGSVCTLNGGSLTVLQGIYVGHGGNAAFNQAGGTSNAALLALGSGSTGTYTLGNGNATFSAIDDGFVGPGNGVISQTGGNLSVSVLTLGYSSGTVGNYTLGNGNLSVTSIEVVGSAAGANGLFTQNGGTHAIAGSLEIGYNAGTVGKYVMNFGTLNVGGVGALSNIDVGLSGNGTFTQAGGNVSLLASLTGPANLIIANQASSSSSYNLNIGNLTVGGNNGTLIVGENGLGVLCLNPQYNSRP